LKPATWKRAFTPYTLTDGSKTAYGHGWQLRKMQGQDTIAHGGGINGFSTVIVRFPAEKHLIVLLDNTAQGANFDQLERELTNILYNQPFNLPRMPVAEVLQKTIADKGTEAAIAQYRELKTQQGGAYDIGEEELNRLGYQLLRARKVNDAIEIFKLNVAEHPKGFNTYDSLGEAYMVSGNTELAVQNYKKSLELNPQNTNATDMLKRLESKSTTVDSKTYDLYAGEYEVTPAFVVKVFMEGDKLMTQATGQPAIELFAEAENKFFARVVNAKVTFNRDEKGGVTGLVIHQGGRDLPAKKIK
jgi:tetratricopeptide (TPR) repeat protein